MFDGDTNFTTNNPILLRNHKKELTIVCAEHTANKEIVTEETLRLSNKNGFGNNVGTVTNRATSMYDIICTLDKNSEEYNIMKNRISSCQLLQQAVIDSSKSGFVTMTMPMKWYTKSKCKTEIDMKLCCDKKPYFMMYIYKQVKREYNSWLKQWNDECYFDFGCTIKDLINKIKRTEEEEEFLIEAYNDMPVSDNNCIMNRLCHMVEKEFDEFIVDRIKNKKEFDYTCLMYRDVIINNDSRNKIEKEINDFVKDYNDMTGYRMATCLTDKDDNVKEKINTLSYYKEYLLGIINKFDKKEFINIFIEEAYTKYNTYKRPLWDLLSEDIIDNLIEENK